MGWFISSGNGQMMLGWGPFGVNMNSSSSSGRPFFTVVSAPLVGTISVKVGTAGLVHCIYRTHLGFLNGRGQERPLFVWEGSG